MTWSGESTSSENWNLRKDGAATTDVSDEFRTNKNTVKGKAEQGVTKTNFNEMMRGTTHTMTEIQGVLI